MIVIVRKRCNKCENLLPAESFYFERHICKKCTSLAHLQRHHAKRRSEGKQPGPRRISKLQNPTVWNLAKAALERPCVYLKKHLHG